MNDADFAKLVKQLGKLLFCNYFLSAAKTVRCCYYYCCWCFLKKYSYIPRLRSVKGSLSCSLCRPLASPVAGPSSTNRRSPLETSGKVSYIVKVPTKHHLTKNNSYAVRLVELDNVELSLYFAQNEVKSTEEFYVYDFFNFLAEVGGTMGLLLGWSLLSLVGWAADRRGCIRRRGEGETAEEVAKKDST